MSDSTHVKRLEEIVVSATRVNELSGMAFTNLGKTSLTKSNLGQDMPILLNSLTSVVTTSDAGTGIGYTGIRIRGTDATRINVTVNGIPFNDSESQGVYWVNMPDISSSTQSVQVVRGVGGSTQGAGAFGGSINLNTLGYEVKPKAEIQLSGGSFDTRRLSVNASTGITKKGLILDARLSSIKSEGFVDRSSSDLSSFYTSLGYYKEASFVRLNVFSGKEKTYQAWNGIPIELFKNDAAGIRAFGERNFFDEEYMKNMVARGRRFNFYDYENETDNYKQSHVQLISNFSLNSGWRFNPSLHYTYGKGYFEQYKYQQSNTDYGFISLDPPNATIISDLIRQKWLQNHFYGGVFTLESPENRKYKLLVGGGFNQYLGGHFGKVIWAENKNFELDRNYYENNSIKNDANVYAKYSHFLSKKWSLYVDGQLRSVSFQSQGILDVQSAIDLSTSHFFFNPKVGVTYKKSQFDYIFLSFARTLKEPSRQDFVDNAAQFPLPEKLEDVELGYRYAKNRISLELTTYWMQYKNQLVNTGKVNAVGEAIRVNIPTSFRRGLEFAIGTKSKNNKLLCNLNFTLSQNKNKEFEEVIQDFSDVAVKVPRTNVYTKTDISFSPNMILGGYISYLPNKKWEISMLPKYVGKQYLDNTQSSNKKLDGYFVSDFRLIFNPMIGKKGNIQFSMLVNNALNTVYASNGYTYSYLYDQVLTTENFVFPQAGTNVLVGLKFGI
ncbi:MAG: TonB-dependent receptor [Leadbetterella sp.]